LGTSPKLYRLSPGRRLINLVVRPLARFGLTGPRTHLLTVPGRRTGRLWSTPVSLITFLGERYAVAPYGERNWVKNARAAGWVELRKGRRRERLEVEELSPAEAVPILREYYRRSFLTHSFFDVSRASSDAEWLAEAPRHPAFRLHAPRV
jgi:deazaflavin-dependent oxidoreductase (nitroreductase family)